MLLQNIKTRVKRVPYVKLLHDGIAYRRWLSRGRPIPPPAVVKQMAVKEYASAHKVHVFIETGTYMGDMVHAVKDIFREIYSMELSHELHEKAKRSFSQYGHISIIEGDSSDVLPRVLDRIKEPCLFWLDAHYSGGSTAKGDKCTPIIRELSIISQHPLRDHVILIDDARAFRGENDYPTLEGLRDLARGLYPAHAFQVADDVIRIYRQDTNCRAQHD